MAEIVAIGEILVEIMATEIGQTFLAPGLFRGPYPSGAPAIFADQAARMGAGTALIGCVGPDDFGTLNLRRLEASGVETGWISRVPGTTTGSAFVTYRPDGNRDFIFNIRNSASAQLRAEQIDPAVFEGCRFFHVMGSSLFDAEIARAVRQGVELARAAGALVSFDPNIRKELLGVPEVQATIEHILAEADLLLPSEADLVFSPSRTLGGRGGGSAHGRPPHGRAEERGARLRAVQARRPPGAAGLSGRRGRSDGGRRLLRGDVRRLPGSGRAGRARPATGQRRRGPGRPEAGADGGELDARPSSRPFFRAGRAEMAAPARHLTDIAARNRQGATAGIYAVCSANRLVLEACFEQAVADDGPLLIEATCNQVNQEGGYTGMTPERFREEVLAIGAAMGYPADRLILGGDHLGPNPWQALPAAEAMAKAKAMVAAYVAAGFAKIHLDASMSCAGDPVALPTEVIAGRAAELCAVAEATARGDGLPGPVYVVGTEVPTPGRRQGGAGSSGGDAGRRGGGHRRAPSRALRGTGPGRGLGAGPGRGGPAGRRVRARAGRRLRARGRPRSWARPSWITTGSSSRRIRPTTRRGRPCGRS